MLKAIVLNCHIAKKNLQEYSYSAECQMTQNILSDTLKQPDKEGLLKIGQSHLNPSLENTIK